MTDTQLQQEIRTALEVVDPQTFDASAEAERRIDFLAAYLEKTGTKGFVLGISGGVDSTTGGRLAQLACERVRERGGEATFIAVRLPYHVQKDEHDAQDALRFIAADEVWTVDIGPAVDAQWEALLAAGLDREDPRGDYHRGNVKARQRMVSQFAIAGARGMLVIGTDQAAEAVVGFFTKFGDGAADLTPLFGLPKRRVREIARHLGAPEHLVEKVPTADLENDKPLIADEVALGVRYEVVDDYLEGKEVSAEDEATIVGWYRRTGHKRALPVTPDGFLQDR
ncbi:ammonia-dependent NAD(+) synthetase [Ornithinimicrobium panacihumi]|uniref:ammonia-dependent NAD(+) synthetase n=1 Tax=Ornithinimicrobium panacihumi TaxID=2008449 RepID=UPI003F8C4873